MEVEKPSSKGRFFQLFEWNVKSRKKLFSNKSELYEGSMQGKENFDSSAMSQLQQMRARENEPGPSIGGCDYSCASSVSNEEGYETKAPGVVARLMGLDSLPTSKVSEPSFTPFFDSHSSRDYHPPISPTDFQSEHHIIGSTRNKLDGYSMNPIELRLQKMQNRPIERFQTEILPPKSAKSISVTHNKLLSPIKSPGFVLTKNAAYIMEAAAKIIEQSPQPNTKGKLPPFGSSSVPLRIGHMKEKMETAQQKSTIPKVPQRAKEQKSIIFMKGQPSARRQNGSEDSKLFKAPVVSKQGGSGSLKNKGKFVSLVNQAKDNVERREGLALSGNRSFRYHKEDNKVMSDHLDKRQRNTQKSVQKRTSKGRTSDVLRQNNQKQNCASNKARASLKPTDSDKKDRKSLSTNGSFRENKTLNKVVENSVIRTRKTNSLVADTGNESSLSETKNSFSGKKRLVNEDVHFNEIVVDDVLINKNERSVKCNVSIDGCMNWDAAERKSSMDVVSFTFTSPIKKPVPGSKFSNKVMEKNKSSYLDPYNDQPNSKTSTLSSLGSNGIGGDALSILLEHKINGLSCRVESVEEMYASTSQDLAPSLDVVNTVTTKHDRRLQFGLDKDKPGSQHDSDCSLVDGLLLKAKQKWQGSEEMEEHNSSINNNECGKELDCQYPGPISSMEASFSDGSCNSSDSKTSFTSNGSIQCLSVEAYEMVSWVSPQKPQLVEGEPELSDSATSISFGGTERKDTTTTFGYLNFERSSHWELEYVREVLSNAELTLKDFAVGRAHKVVNPTLFDQLENQITELDKNMEECFFGLGRKVLFDCVTECVEFRVGRLFGGGCEAWIKGSTLFRRKEWLAEEIYKEMYGWTSMGDLMVDELLGKDMSSQYGKWVDFEIEEFEEGVEIEKGILTSLVDELVGDLLLS